MDAILKSVLLFSNLFFGPIEKASIPLQSEKHSDVFSTDSNSLVFRSENKWLNPSTIVSLYYDQHPERLSLKYISYLDESGYVLRKVRVNPINDTVLTEQLFEYSEGKLKYVYSPACCTTKYVYNGQNLDSIFETTNGIVTNTSKLKYSSNGDLTSETNYYVDFGTPTVENTKYEYFLPDSMTSLRTYSSDTASSIFSVIYFENGKIVKQIKYPNSLRNSPSYMVQFKYSLSNAIRKIAKRHSGILDASRFKFGTYNILGVKIGDEK